MRVLILISGYISLISRATPSCHHGVQDLIGGLVAQSSMLVYSTLLRHCALLPG